MIIIIVVVVVAVVIVIVVCKENQQKLFKNIVQFNAAELQEGGGSGLGLWSK